MAVEAKAEEAKPFPKIRKAAENQLGGPFFSRPISTTS